MILITLRGSSKPIVVEVAHLKTVTVGFWTDTLLLPSYCTVKCIILLSLHDIDVHLVSTQMLLSHLMGAKVWMKSMNVQLHLLSVFWHWWCVNVQLHYLPISNWWCVNVIVSCWGCCNIVKHVIAMHSVNDVFIKLMLTGIL